MLNNIDLLIKYKEFYLNFFLKTKRKYILFNKFNEKVFSFINKLCFIFSFYLPLLIISFCYFLKKLPNL